MLGKIFHVYNSSQDDGSSISLTVKTKRLNPFVEEGLNARFGWVDIFTETDATITLTVELFVNQDTTAYKSEDIILTGTGIKCWHRVYSGAIGTFHQIKISHTASNATARIYALVPYFAPVKGKYET